MPTPNLYDNIALQFFPYKRRVLAIVGLSLLLILLPVLASITFQLNIYSLSGAGFITLILGWGLFLVTMWFGSDSKKKSKLPKLILNGFRWYAAIFLDIWFVAGSFTALYVVWISLFK